MKATSAPGYSRTRRSESRSKKAFISQLKESKQIFGGKQDQKGFQPLSAMENSYEWYLFTFSKSADCLHFQSLLIVLTVYILKSADCSWLFIFSKSADCLHFQCQLGFFHPKSQLIVSIFKVNWLSIEYLRNWCWVWDKAEGRKENFQFLEVRVQAHRT